MDIQQIITMGIVLVATLYLGRRLVSSVRSLLSSSNTGGCGEGCGKCEFAKLRKPGEVGAVSVGATGSQRIAISDIQMAPHRKQKTDN